MFGVKENDVIDNGASGIGSELTVGVEIACAVVDGSASEMSVLESSVLVLFDEISEYTDGFNRAVSRLFSFLNLFAILNE